MPAIVFDDSEDEKSWCSDCDALLIERRDQSFICSYCARVYQPDSIKKFKSKLGPLKDPYSDEGPELIPMTSYTEKQKKPPSVFEKEDRFFQSKSGRSITSYEDYWPA
jgi:hypothetical protein